MKILIKQPNKLDIEFDLPEGSYIEVLKNEEILVQKELFEEYDIYETFCKINNNKEFFNDRKRESIELKYLFIKMLHDHTDCSQEEMATYAGIDRTTVIHALSAIESKLAVTPSLRKTYKEVLSKLRGE